MGSLLTGAKVSKLGQRSELSACTHVLAYSCIRYVLRVPFLGVGYNLLGYDSVDIVPYIYIYKVQVDIIY